MVIFLSTHLILPYLFFYLSFLTFSFVILHIFLLIQLLSVLLNRLKFWQYQILLQLKQYIKERYLTFYLATQYMQIDTFQYPPDQQRIQIHKAASRIGKLRNQADSTSNYSTTNNLQKCSDCGREVNSYPKFKCHETEQQLQDRYGIYGPNCFIYLAFIKRLAIFLLICTLIFALPMFILNLKGTSCKLGTLCLANDTIHNWSLYNLLGVHTTTLPHIALWFIFSIFIIAFNFYLRAYVLTTYRRINNDNITDSDYCILLRRLPELVSKDEIRDLIDSEIQRINEQPGSAKKLMHFSIRDILMIQRLDETAKSLKKQVKQFKKAAKKGQINNFIPVQLVWPSHFANAAIVRFHTMTTNKQIVEQTTSSFCQNLLNFFCVFYNPKTQHKINDTHISLENAPHPTDMLWANFGFSQRNRIIRKILLTIVAIIILILSGIVSLLLSYWMELITNERGQRPVYLTILNVIIVLIFNRIIRKIVIYTTKLQRLDTKTDQDSQQISLIVLHQSLNLGFFSIIVPILVQLPSELVDKTTKSSSFPLVMFTTILIQALATNLLNFFMHLFEIKQKISKYLSDKKISIRTYTQAMGKYIGEEVPFVECYAWNVKIIWFGFLYAVITPISVFIAFVGMTMSYFIQRYLFNNKYSIPYYGGPRLNDEMIRLLDWTPLIIGLFNLFIYQKYQSNAIYADSRILGLIVTIIVIGVINLFVPWKNLAKIMFKPVPSKKDDLYEPSNLQITYEQSSPYYRKTPLMIYRQPQTFEQLRYKNKRQKAALHFSRQFEFHTNNQAGTANDLINPTQALGSNRSDI